MTTKRLFTALVLSVFLSACSTKIATIEASQLIGVTGFDITLNNGPAVGIAIGDTAKDFVEVSTQRRLIAAESVITASANNNADIAISAYWHDKRYVQSTVHNTYVTLRIHVLDNTSKTAFVSVSARLVNIDTGEFIAVEQTQVSITGQDFLNLVWR
ncbi:hypothetical protein HWV00_04530 [Moritella sp. 24]|uniref:hypothetical protein n=1 Tax=Moritella sp. 24 TaxID=2746230 RepID=UPI001BADE3AB|nr:hypothetical protein [Moritella sp. 24]QUM75556.1 hypothetical protein HWV00_04530 [Moritella sp. 24]